MDTRWDFYVPVTGNKKLDMNNSRNRDSLLRKNTIPRMGKQARTGRKFKGMELGGLWPIMGHLHMQITYLGLIPHLPDYYSGLGLGLEGFSLPFCNFLSYVVTQYCVRLFHTSFSSLSVLFSCLTGSSHLV